MTGKAIVLKHRSMIPEAIFAQLVRAKLAEAAQGRNETRVELGLSLIRTKLGVMRAQEQPSFAPNGKRIIKVV